MIAQYDGCTTPTVPKHISIMRIVKSYDINYLRERVFGSVPSTEEVSGHAIYNETNEKSVIIIFYLLFTKLCLRR